MLKFYIIFLTLSAFVATSLSLALLFIGSCYFRKKIAVPHGFSEGLVTGAAFPCLVFSYALIFIQSASFIAFPTTSELFLIIRMFIFLVTVVLFIVFRIFTPPLLSLWFGKRSLWFKKGEKGKIPYFSIYGAQIDRVKATKQINNQQLYKISFFAENKKFFSVPYKFTCRLTAKQIVSLKDELDFEPKQNSAVPVSPVYILRLSVSFLAIFSLAVVLFLLICSRGVFSVEKYTREVKVSDKEISTVTEISEIYEYDSKVFVYYGMIGGVNVYGSQGDYLYSVTFPSAIFRKNELQVCDGYILYRTGNDVIKCDTDGKYLDTVDYDQLDSESFQSQKNISSLKHDSFNVYAEDGNKVLIRRPEFYRLFSQGVLWVFATMLVISLFSIKFLSEQADYALGSINEKNMIKSKSNNKEKKTHRI